ncbi:4-(cytidine 5'-diphospho)-2-C-methyl-D-erythritol kinase [Thermostilla marina]
MRLVWQRDGLRIETPAKVNLHFELIRRREDGFHDVETLVCPVALYDTLVFESGPAGEVSLACRWDYPTRVVRRARFPEIPNDERNLVIRAAERLRSEYGVPYGARITLIKRIPAGAGLGGGSSDAAAALVGLASLWRLPLESDRLRRLGASLGSDVPLFLVRGASFGRGRGELVTPVSGLPPMWFVIARPGFSVATAEVYRNVSVPSDPVVGNPWSVTLRRGSVDAIGRLFINRLEEGACRVEPRMDEFLRRLRRVPGPLWRMTGSGSCCYALCGNRRQARATARRAAALPGVCWTTVVPGSS